MLRLITDSIRRFNLDNNSLVPSLIKEDSIVDSFDSTFFNDDTCFSVKCIKANRRKRKSLQSLHLSNANAAQLFGSLSINNAIRHCFIANELSNFSIQFSMDFLGIIDLGYRGSCFFF